jgi:2-polyprenyl-3-methyl-5-hydroxy-6-metoxy-1,4-benzoquinol methylase
MDMGKFQDKQFEVVFSNSVIEHVGNLGDQKRMADEVMRTGKRYFVQTPNYYFPIEPHVLLPAYHWLPRSVRIYLTRHFKLGWKNKISDYEKAKDLIDRTRLLKKKEFSALFPEARIYEEKFYGLVKSFVAYGGW